jgi:formate hydrogenlyase subunit 4
MEVARFILQVLVLLFFLAVALPFQRQQSFWLLQAAAAVVMVQQVLTTAAVRVLADTVRQ